jgi:hypothetical protein
MKKLAIVAIGLAAGFALQAQGFVSFANLGSGLLAPYKDVGGANLSGSYVVELWAGTTANTLLAVPGTQKTVNFNASGFFNAGTVSIPVSQLDASGNGFASVKVWANPGGVTSWGQASTTQGLKVGQTGGIGGGSFAIKANMLDPTLPPPPGAVMKNMSAITMYNNPVPEPSVIALGILGAAALFLRRRK